jgi:hypothetical protein
LAVGPAQPSSIIILLLETLSTDSNGQGAAISTRPAKVMREQTSTEDRCF